MICVVHRQFDNTIFLDVVKRLPKKNLLLENQASPWCIKLFSYFIVNRRSGTSGPKWVSFSPAICPQLSPPGVVLNGELKSRFGSMITGTRARYVLSNEIPPPPLVVAADFCRPRRFGFYVRICWNTALKKENWLILWFICFLFHVCETMDASFYFLSMRSNVTRWLC
jgi:hypothetical protein